VTTVGLESVKEFTIPVTILDATLDALAKAGRRGEEAFVVWGGKIDDVGGSAHVMSAIQPEQQPISTPDGLLVVVDGDALFALNRTFYQRGEAILAQVHAHPTEAFHSDTDDMMPLATTTGALSLVVHDFACHGRHQIEQWAWYRLVATGVWMPLDSSTTITLR